MELKSKPLDWWINNLGSMSRDIWLWIPSKTKSLTPETECFAVADDVDLSNEEQDRRDLVLDDNGLICFIYRDQLEDIQINLKAQKEKYEITEFYLALNYYWENDAFINISHV